MRNTKIMLLIALTLTLGCSKSDEYQPKKTKKIVETKVAAGEERTLAPMAVGNQWVYTRQQGSSKAEITMKVTAVRQTPDGDTDATINIRQITAQGAVDESTIVWLVNDTGIYQSSSADSTYDPPQLLVPFPLKKGNEWQEVKQEGIGGRPYSEAGPYQIRVRVLGTHEVDTDKGRMSAIAIESVTEWETEAGPAASITLSWWKPGVGFVRQVQEVRTPAGTVKDILKLKSYLFPGRSQ